MNIFKNILSKNKSYAIATTISALTAAYILYKYLKQQSDQTRQQKTIKKIIKLKQQINRLNPSFNQFKLVMEIAIQSARYHVRQLSKKYSKKRKEFNSQARQNKFNQYLDLLYEEIVETDAVAVRQLRQIGVKCGIDQRFYKIYENIVQDSLKQIMQGNDQLSEKQLLTLQQTKQAIKLKIKFIKQSGQPYVQLIIKTTKSWSLNQKTTLPIIFPIVIADLAYGNRSQFDSDIVQQSSVKYQNQLIGQLQQLQIVMTPLMLKLNALMRQTTGLDFVDSKKQINKGMPLSTKQDNQLHQIQKMQMDNYQDINRMILLNSTKKQHVPSQIQQNNKDNLRDMDRLILLNASKRHLNK